MPPAVLSMEVELSAAPAVVWQQLTQPESLRSWFWPARLQPVVTVEPHSGGNFHIASQTTDLAVTGLIVDVETEARLMLAWRWADEVNETELELRLRETKPCHTRLILRHSGHPNEAAVSDHRQGWTDCLQRLSDRIDMLNAARASTEKKIMDFVTAGMAVGGLLLDENDLEPAFFELSTGLLGELFQKFSNYQLQLAVVLPDAARFGDRLVELVSEHHDHQSIRVFETVEAARAWLAATTDGDRT